MRSTISRGILAVCVLLAPTVRSGPAYPQGATDPCEGQSGVTATACKQAKDLLFSGSAQPRADATVRVTSSRQGWLYDHRTEETRTDSGESCPLSGPLVLPAGKRVELIVTSRDDIYEWSVPSLGMRTTAIPGRVESVFVESAEAGVSAGRVSTTASGATSMSGDIRVVAPDAFVSWLTGLQTQPCK